MQLQYHVTCRNEVIHIYTNKQIVDCMHREIFGPSWATAVIHRGGEEGKGVIFVGCFPYSCVSVVLSRSALPRRERELRFLLLYTDANEPHALGYTEPRRACKRTNWFHAARCVDWWIAPMSGRVLIGKVSPFQPAAGAKRTLRPR